MKTTTINLYTFDELSKDVQAKVLDKYRDINTDIDTLGWYPDLTSEKEKALYDLGYVDAKIKFSGFGSQGDGASFTASVDLPTVCKLLKIELPQSFLDWCDDEGASLEVVRGTGYISNHYFHENTVSAEMQNAYYSPEQFDNLIAELENKVTADVREESKKIYRAIEEDYTYHTSDENVADTIRANEYMFEADGTMRNDN